MTGWPVLEHLSCSHPGHEFGCVHATKVLLGHQEHSPDRIEVLGFILLLSLLTWNLMEHVMRAHLKRTDSTISGCDRKPTTRPTTFMMTTKFKGVLVAKIGEEWHFTAPLTGEQQQYVRALGLSEEALLRKGGPFVQKSPRKRL